MPSTAATSTRRRGASIAATCGRSVSSRMSLTKLPAPCVYLSVIASDRYDSSIRSAVSD
jgi:hypothetical protein